MERFADLVDMAQAHTERETALAIDRLRYLATSGHGSDYCLDCGIQIPGERRRRVPGAVRCVACQHGLEQNLSRRSS